MMANKSALSKIIVINLVLCAVVFIGFSFGLRWFLNAGSSADDSTQSHTPNTIRATFPNYENMDRKIAAAVFEGPKKKPIEYSTFTGWQRTPFDNGVVTVEEKYRTRLSTGHQISGSTWFLGGSTTWGTGATNDTTIPSFYSKLTGESVWNLGESGYNSFQELVRLQIMLARGLKPKRVIFYDGVNDTSYCNTNAKTLPVHLRSDQHAQYVNNFISIRRQLAQARNELKDKQASIDFYSVVSTPVRYILQPYKTAYDLLTDKRAVGGTNKTVSTSNENPFSSFSRKRNYKVCGDDPERAMAAAAMTVEGWFLAHDLLKARNIPVYFFLQPTAHIKAEEYRLDHILDRNKQKIADERSSYEARYTLTEKYWNDNCSSHHACGKFFNISEILTDIKEPVFIDAFHLSPNGNEVVAKTIVQKIADK